MPEDAARFGAAVHAYVRAVAGAVSDVVRAGPFTALLSRTSSAAPWNYAIPDDDAQPSDADVATLVAVFQGRGLQPRVEAVPAAVPAVGPALLRGGFRVDEELPLMACDPGSWVELQPPSHVRLRHPQTTDELRAMALLQHEVFADATPVNDAFLVQRRSLQETGGLLLMAETASGRVVGAGVCPPPHARLCEIVGVAVAEPERRRGIAGAITSQLTREAFNAGCDYVYLEAAEGAGGAYARAGFRPLASVAHYAR